MRTLPITNHTTLLHRHAVDDGAVCVALRDIRWGCSGEDEGGEGEEEEGENFAGFGGGRLS